MIQGNMLGGDGTEAQMAFTNSTGAQTLVLASNGEHGALQVVLGNGPTTAVVLDGNVGASGQRQYQHPIGSNDFRGGVSFLVLVTVRMRGGHA